jgi:uncharacterized protein
MVCKEVCAGNKKQNAGTDERIMETRMTTRLNLILMKRLPGLYRQAFFSILLLLFAAAITAQQADPFEKIKTVPEKLEPLSFGEIKPAGWLKAQIENNLDGFTGHLDSLAPGLVTTDDIYGSERLTKKVKSKDVGALGDAGDWQVQFLWWNSETQSNWWDGYIRSAVLANNPWHLQRIKTYVARILSTQDADGYLGIYDRELRYRFDNENGELWSKTTLLRGLLAWYEYTKDKKVLTAVERAVQDVMDHYPLNASHPFYSVKPDVGGLSHGLTFTDVLENLYRITGRELYLDYSLFFYKDFSGQVLNEDAQYKKLADTTLLLKGHGVHTYEHLRTVAAAYYASGNPVLKTALQRFLQKIGWTTTASGGPVGDEWIGGRKADATSRGYEYCSLQELLHSYTDLFAKSGDPAYGDQTERLFFNAAQGARHPTESCIAYLKSDNSYYMTGGPNGDTSVKHQTRYTYSPVHQDAAVCCVPNAGRITPYYVQNMWLRDSQGLVASLLGPCDVETVWKGTPVAIKETTSYPYGYSIVFEIETTDLVFDLKIRKPGWATQFSVSERYKEQDGFIVIQKKWNGKQTVKVTFFPGAQPQYDRNNEAYFVYGPLVLARSIEGKAVQTKSYPVKGFHDLQYTPANLVVYRYRKDKIVQPVKDSLVFTTRLLNPATGQPEPVVLEPMGKTILRQVTFKQP